MTSQCLDMGGKLPASGSDFRLPARAQQRRQMLYRRESIETGRSMQLLPHDRERTCEKTALAAVFMASCSGFKEVDFCEMNKFVAAISHDHLLLVD